jgi:plasmid stabilization system protein ParE
MTFPTAGRVRENLMPGLRSYVVYPFVVFYSVHGSRKTVVVERVLHGHLDIDSDNFA